MVTRVTQPATDRPIVEDDLTQSTQFRSWTRIITNQALIIGTGSPEGVVEASQGASYMNDAGTASAIMYLKRDNDDGAGNKKIGWILV